MKAVVTAFNQEKALVGAFSVITNLRMELFQALLSSQLLETPAEETKIVIKDESSCEEFKSNLTMTGCGWKFMVVF